MRAEIREFLSTRRAKITPEQAGLPTYGDDRRRVPGLRREETALLVGVSPQYYIRLERGDATGVSESVIDGIAHALKLDDAERAHLLDLLRTAGTPVPIQAAHVRQQPTGSDRPSSDWSTPCPPCRPSSSTDASTSSPHNALGRALFSPWYADRRPGEQRPPRLPRPTRHDVLPRVGDRRERHRRPAPRRSRPRPLRPRAHRPRRRAVHPQRGLPRPLGRPRRPHPQHRHQEAAPPRSSATSTCPTSHSPSNWAPPPASSPTWPNPAHRPRTRSPSSRAGKPARRPRATPSPRPSPRFGFS